TWTWNTNMGQLRRVWDVEGNPLEFTAEKALQDEMRFTIQLTSKAKGAKKASAYVSEVEMEQRAKTFEGLTLMRRVFTSSEAAERTFVFQLPPKVTFLAVAPLPVEMSTEDAGTFVLLREKRDAFVSYDWDIVWSEDAEVARRWLDLGPDERARWLLR